MDLERALHNLPPDANEALVNQNFSSKFLEALGFEELEVSPQFPVGRGIVDFAARKNTTTDLFCHSRQNPYLYMEVKGRSCNLGDERHNDYVSTVNQLKGYLLDSSFQAVRWGIITNSLHAQLFRKHGKIVHPVTPSISLTSDINHAVAELKKHVEKPRKALTIAVYNNKGGVGKTTTTLNLASTLTLYSKKVLVVDFDPNQSDLGDALNLAPLNGELFAALTAKKVDIREVIKRYEFRHPSLANPLSFDVLLADAKFTTPDTPDVPGRDLTHYITLHALKTALNSVAAVYDYILIDAPPNWRIFAQKALYASDVVLIPARHDNLHSLQNAATAITRFIPEIQSHRQKRGEFGPIALPIFLNNSFKVTGPQMELMHRAIAKIVNAAKAPPTKIDLNPYFYPKNTQGHIDQRMIKIPYMANISKSDFLSVPASFAFRVVREQYWTLIKEYFIQ